MRAQAVLGRERGILIRRADSARQLENGKSQQPYCGDGGLFDSRRPGSFPPDQAFIVSSSKRVKPQIIGSSGSCSRTSFDHMSYVLISEMKSTAKTEASACWIV